MVLTLSNIKTSVGVCGRLFTPLKPRVLENINIKGLKLSPYVAEDIFQPSQNSAVAINKNLKTLYNIDSNIINPDLAKQTLSAVEDFVNVNKKNKMFSGLKIESKFWDNAGIFSNYKYDTDKKSFSIIFNENFDWKNLAKITQTLYDQARISSNNPAYLIYRDLGNFLNFKYNPHAFDINTTRKFIEKSELRALKVSNNADIEKFNANYIAGRMCGEAYPKKLYTLFEENLGNTDLRFPKAMVKNFKQGSIHKFKSIEDAKKYLSQHYAIMADFMNLEQANLFAGSVDDLSKALNSKEYFKGLKVFVDSEKFDSVTTKACIKWNKETGEAKIYINPAFNWKSNSKLCRNDFDSGYHPSANPKDTFTHELVHWLDFKGNPEKYGTTEFAFHKGETVYTDFGKLVTAKVSTYAANSPAEFNAEYICGRLNGIKYPAATNNEFVNHWNGPALTF